MNKRAFWNAMKDKYPWHAESPTSVKPTLVKVEDFGHHVSAGLRIGWRTWGFKTEAARDRFCMQFGGRKL